MLSLSVNSWTALYMMWGLPPKPKCKF
uniref:Uncharacterized protein n=1 Tax=Rhizophora mucronata TaxID=61149 RepID=A0A2P2LEK7_RHIMU